MRQNEFAVFSGTKSAYLTEEICKSLGCELKDSAVDRFADGEFAVYYEESIRGKDVFWYNLPNPIPTTLWSYS